MTPKVQVTVRGHWRSVQLEAIIDTGFDGSLCLPMDVADHIGAHIAGWGQMRLADGSISSAPAVYCHIECQGMTSSIVAFVTKEYDDLIIGTELLQGCQLMIDFDSG